MVAISASSRVNTYSPVASAGPFPIDFPLFDDTGADLRVTLDDLVVTGWTYSGTIESGFYGAPNTWVNGSILFDAPITGALVIKGARAPRRQAQYAEGRGIPARDHNSEYNVLTAVQQEQAREFASVADTAQAAADLVASVGDDVAAVSIAAGAAATAASNATVAANTALAAAAALVGKSVTAAGLATGGGFVTDSPTITVPAASQAEAEAGTDPAKVPTVLRTAQAIQKRAEDATFTPLGTGAVARTIKARFRDWCSVLDFGADPSGVTNSTAAFLAALTAYGTVEVPDGNYKVVNLYFPASGRRLVGRGKSAALQIPNGSNSQMFAGSGLSFISIQNLTLDGNRANNIAGNGTDFSGCFNIEIKDCLIRNWVGNGIIAQVNCSDVMVSRNYISNVGSHGVSISAVNGCVIDNNVIVDAGIAGINFGAAANFTVSGNTIRRAFGLGPTGLGAGGIRTTNTTVNGTITGNTIEAMDRGIMLITGAQRTTVSGNNIFQPWYDGIFIQGTAPLPTLDIAVTGNVVRDANAHNSGSYDGIRIDGEAGAIITSGNVIRDSRGAPQMQYGIRDSGAYAATNIGRSAAVNSISGAAIALVN